jgi:hypothetical protein
MQFINGNEGPVAIGGSSTATPGRARIAAGASAAAPRKVRRLMDLVTYQLSARSAWLRAWLVLAHDHRTRLRIGCSCASRIDSEQPVRHDDGSVHINVRRVGKPGGDVQHVLLFPRLATSCPNHLLRSSWSSDGSRYSCSTSTDTSANRVIRTDSVLADNQRGCQRVDGRVDRAQDTAVVDRRCGRRQPDRPMAD